MSERMVEKYKFPKICFYWPNGRRYRPEVSPLVTNSMQEQLVLRAARMCSRKKIQIATVVENIRETGIWVTERAVLVEWLPGTKVSTSFRFCTREIPTKNFISLSAHFAKPCASLLPKFNLYKGDFSWPTDLPWKNKIHNGFCYKNKKSVSGTIQSWKLNE